MDIDDISEFTILNLFGERTMSKFIEAQTTYVDNRIIFKVFIMHYIIKTKGTCWTNDVLDALSKTTRKSVEISMYYMCKNKFITKHQRDKILGTRYELTNKSTFLIRQYAAWLREEERKYHYKMKESHKKSRELKEK